MPSSTPSHLPPSFPSPPPTSTLVSAAPPTDALSATTTSDRPASPTKPTSSSSVKGPFSTSTAPIRPPARQTRSKLDQEPNPFEQSFSGRSASVEGQEVKVEGSADVRVTVEGATAIEGLVGGPLGEEDHKPLLPSVSQLVSPEHEDGPFNWNINTPNISSLRSGPLSPAMLAGPKQGQQAVVSHAMQFDASNFVRTGLTPGTGLTPLSGGPSSFPPPSPNTAAFLAMVTNATAAASQTGPDGAPLPLTPGTFNTVMSQLGNLNGPSHVSGQVVGGHQPHPLANSHVVGGGQPDYFSHRPEEGQQTHVQQQQQQQQHQQQMMTQQQHYPHPQVGYVQQFPPQQPGGPLPPHLVHQQHGGPPPPPEHYRQQNVAAASQAANGLFLLSQAHQEIAAREHDGPGGPHNHLQHQPPKATHPGAGPLVPPPSTRVGNKRKTSGSTEAAAPPARKNARAAAGGAAAKRGKKAMSVESDDYDGMEGMSPDNGGSENGANGVGNGLNKDGKPETEEEKRKNFLERNRQAALKCRQRKKAWLGQLQAKVEYLQGENEGLQQTIAQLRDEVSRLSGMVGGGAPGGPVYINGTGQPQAPPLVPGAPAAGGRRGGPAY